MTLKQDIDAGLLAANTKLDAIAADVQRLKDTIPASGGLTEAEANDVRDQVNALVAKATGIDDQTPEA